MPAHFDITTYYPEIVDKLQDPLITPHDLCVKQYNRLLDGRPVAHLDVIQSSFKTDSFNGLDVRSKQNGFVHTVTQAYNDHHHLIMRPDDVWICILSQFSIYINKNAETFREKFVTHKGKEKLVVTMRSNRDTENLGFLCQEMTALVQANILDTDLRKWMIPSFTTTKENDVVICSVIMMATMKSYFEYEMSKCGIPEVTLEGEREDWVQLRMRIERLSKYGEEPTKWLRLLRPVLDRFIGVFDGEDDVDFWDKVSVDYSLGSGLRFLSGWITAFCVWDNDGNWQGDPQTEPYTMFGVENFHQNREINGVMYPTVPTEKIPMGFCQVDVRIIDGFGKTDCVMLSGHMSTLVEGERMDTVRPYPTWFIFAEPEQEQELQSMSPLNSSSPYPEDTQDTCLQMPRLVSGQELVLVHSEERISTDDPTVVSSIEQTGRTQCGFTRCCETQSYTKLKSGWVAKLGTLTKAPDKSFNFSDMFNAVLVFFGLRSTSSKPKV